MFDFIIDDTREEILTLSDDEYSEALPTNGLSITLPQLTARTDIRECSDLPLIQQPKLQSYKKRQFGHQKRSFNDAWYASFPWIEYYPDSDSVTCYPCKQFKKLISAGGDTFSSGGFQHWKHALEKKRGFNRHEESNRHKQAMSHWSEYKVRKSSATSVSKLVTKADPEHQTWLFAVFQSLKFIVMNGCPMRGDNESTDFESGDVGGGLFLSCFNDLLFPMDPHLEELARRLPKNAKCSSPMFQNEVIDILAGLVKSRIARECRESGVYTTMLDGTEDSNGDEMEAVVLRYWLGNRAVEHVLTVEHAEDRTAKGLLDILVKTLDKDNIPLEGILSDCLDGVAGLKN